jgi:hypothetical protein
MNDDTYKALLKDLQKLEKRIADAHIARVRGDAGEQARLAALHAAAEVGGRADDYVAMQARKSAVQFLLRTVYVRVLEDLGTLEPVRIRGGWGEEAFRAIAPALGKRAYFEFIFRDLAQDFPVLFMRGANELDLPAEDLCRDAWALWHKEDGRGNILYDWRPVEADGGAASFDSRFLGDLYQDLDAEVRKRYALLQTPVFVERYILDKTLTPALVEFDPAVLRTRGETFRVLDPTCGSGHFLVGAFHRMAAYWEGKGLGKWEAAERALESVWGCDINPHAVDIASFRLLLEVRGRTGVNDLDRLAGLTLNLAVLDSLIPWERSNSLFPAMDRLSKYATSQERKENAAFFGQAFHVVVGNPPYIRPKDKQKLEDYKEFWPQSAAGRYALSAPFAERILTMGVRGAFSGQITANSFAKRSFGKPLIEKVLPTIDISRIVDSSGAYLPGHGTPTVILFGRQRRPMDLYLWAILGKRGEPRRPADPASGLVWNEIASSQDVESDASAFVTITRAERASFASHPWSLGGGLSRDVASTAELAGETLGDRRPVIGNATQLKGDDLYFAPPPSVRRDASCPSIKLVEGEFVRDWEFADSRTIPYPYEYGTKHALALPMSSGTLRHFWRFRTSLFARPSVGFRTVRARGLLYYEFPFYAPQTVRGMSIPFAFVASGNQFVLSRGGLLFKQSAYSVQLPSSATLDDHLDLLGLLNSSTLGFWMKQVFHDKRLQGEDWETFFEYDATKLQKAPLATVDRDTRLNLARALDDTARQRAAFLPAALLATGTWSPADLRARLDHARARYRELTLRMSALQDELDWLTYGSYKLIDPVETVPPDAIEPLAPGHRPFEILFARTDDDADPDEKSAWWSRHGHDRVTEIPAHYSPAHRARLQARMDLIEADPRLQLLEAPAYKRRWQTPDLAKAEKEDAESWLLDRLEDLFAPKSDQSRHSAAGELTEPKPYRLEAVVAAWQRDPRVAAVAGVWTGSGAATDLTLVAEKLLSKNAIPDNLYRVYTAEGLLKLGEWKRVWALQDQEDAKVAQLIDPSTNAPLLDEAGKPTNTIPLPPKFDKADFQADYFATRGKLNVPRERFIAFTDLRPTRYGWNGWRDRERALAQVEAYTLAETDPELPLPVPTSADPRRCGPTLGLWESLPDVKRWASADEHAELSSLAQEVCRQPRCPCPVVEKWQAWRRGDLALGAEGTGATATVSVKERAMVMALFDKKQTSLLGGDTYEELPHDKLVARWKGPAGRLETVLDDLVATGDVVVKGQGARRQFARSGRAI